jgi:hypothetical protein
MPPIEKDTLQILVQIAGDIGETRGDIASLKDNVGSITEDFKEVKDQLTRTVTKPECTQRHVIVAKSIDTMRQEILAEFKKPTGNFSAVTPAMLKAAVAPSLQEIETALEQKNSEKVDKKRRAVTFWLITLSTATALLGGCAVGIYNFVLFMNKLENVVSTQSEEVKSEFRKAKNNIVYVQMPMSVDSGVAPFLPKTKIMKAAKKPHQ